MKIILLLLFIGTCFTRVSAQLEISTGYAVDRNLADGAPILIAYDLKIKDRFYTKSQIGFKYLYHHNEFVGATLQKYIYEFHQTLSYEIIKKKKYILKPNLGLNYRVYRWKGRMDDPLNTLPIRAWIVGTRKGNFKLVNDSDGASNQYNVNNWGFTIQIQNQFKLNDKFWFQITPFIEPDYDRSQNVGGCYVGIIFKNL